MLARFLFVALGTLTVATWPAPSHASDELTAAAERLFTIGAEPSAKALARHKRTIASCPRRSATRRRSSTLTPSCCAFSDSQDVADAATEKLREQPAYN